MDLSFNTQPPEGGWFAVSPLCVWRSVFQHTAARRRLGIAVCIGTRPCTVSTHSRPKAAGILFAGTPTLQAVSTHSRPKAAGILHAENPELAKVSTHSRPKAAGSASLPN